MPNLDAGSNTFRALQLQYAQLPWYKTLGFWFSAPRLAWGLFGYKQTPTRTRIGELLDLAQAS